MKKSEKKESLDQKVERWGQERKDHNSEKLELFTNQLSVICEEHDIHVFSVDGKIVIGYLEHEEQKSLGQQFGEECKG
jgi:hypothetical protein